MKSTPIIGKQRRRLLLGTLAEGATAAAPALLPIAASARSSMMPQLAVHNAYRQVNLAASKAAYGAAFTFHDMVDAWGVAIRPAGAGGHFWVAAGGKSHQFVSDVIALDCLWALMFGNGVSLGDANALYFAAGTAGEAAGLFGSLRYSG